MKRPSPKLSDRELDALLQGMREDVAAPADFRARVMRRLQAEGLLQAAPAPARLGLAARVAAWARPARLAWGLGFSAAALLLFAIVGRTPQGGPALQPAPSAAAVAPAQPQPRVLAQAPAKPKATVLAAAKPAPAPAPQQNLELPRQAPAPVAQGRSDAQPAASTVQVASVVSKPTVVVDYPESPKALLKSSEVRNNVIHASRNEAADIVFNLTEAGRVRVEVYDRLGRRVAVLMDEDRGLGRNDLHWTGASDQGGMAASGIYEVRITGPGLAARHKVLLAK